MKGIVWAGASPAPFAMAKFLVPKSDWKFMKPDADPDFSVERNKRVVAETIKKNEKEHLLRRKKFLDEAGDKADVITTWVKSLKGGEKPIDAYIGKQWMIKLAGEKILYKIKKLRELRNKYPQLRGANFENIV